MCAQRQSCVRVCVCVVALRDTTTQQQRRPTHTLAQTHIHKPQDNLPPGSLGDLAPDRGMTFEEKRKLSAHMASIPGEKLAAVLDIVYEGEVRAGRGL